MEKQNVQEQLLEASKTLNYDDGCYGQAIRAFRSHFRIIALAVPQFEAAGFEVVVDLNLHRMGGSSVKLLKDGQEMEIYSMFYDTFGPPYGHWGGDDDMEPLLEKIQAALQTVASSK
jgi:hypothetical protein